MEEVIQRIEKDFQRALKEKRDRIYVEGPNPPEFISDLLMDLQDLAEMEKSADREFSESHSEHTKALYDRLEEVLRSFRDWDFDESSGIPIKLKFVEYSGVKNPELPFVHFQGVIGERTPAHFAGASFTTVSEDYQAASYFLRLKDGYRLMSMKTRYVKTNSSHRPGLRSYLVFHRGRITLNGNDPRLLDKKLRNLLIRIAKALEQNGVEKLYAEYFTSVTYKDEEEEEEAEKYTKVSHKAVAKLKEGTYPSEEHTRLLSLVMEIARRVARGEPIRDIDI